MKKILAILLVAIVAFTSCGTASKDAVELELYYYKQENQDGLKNLLAAFEKDNPGITVKTLIIPNDADADRKSVV